MRAAREPLKDSPPAEKCHRLILGMYVPKRKPHAYIPGGESRYA